MSFPIVTAWLAIFLSLLVIFFIIKIAMIRRRERIELESGKNEKLRRMVRSHGNLVETAPLFLILLAFSEMLSPNSFIAMPVAAIFAISRIIHPIGLSGIKGTFKFRTYGMILTMTAYIAAALHLAIALIGSSSIMN